MWMTFNTFKLRHFHCSLGETNVFFLWRLLIDSGKLQNDESKMCVFGVCVCGHLHKLTMHIESWKSHLDLGIGD